MLELPALGASIPTAVPRAETDADANPFANPNASVNTETETEAEALRKVKLLCPICRRELSRESTRDSRTAISMVEPAHVHDAAHMV